MLERVALAALDEREAAERLVPRGEHRRARVGGRIVARGARGGGIELAAVDQQADDGAVRRGQELAPAVALGVDRLLGVGQRLGESALRPA